MQQAAPHDTALHLLQLREDAGAASHDARQPHQRVQVVLPARSAEPPVSALEPGSGGAPAYCEPCSGESRSPTHSLATTCKDLVEDTNDLAHANRMGIISWRLGGRGV